MTPEYNTILFTNIYDSSEKFLERYADSGLPKTITDDNASILFYLLLARYGNNPIANMDVHQWEVKLFSVIWQYGPSWEKRLEIQSKIRNLTEAELIAGSKQISNHALNPNTSPDTSSLEELDYINEQSTNSYKRSKIEAYGQLLSLIRTDVTSEFLDKFVNLFKKFVRPEMVNIYETEE